MNYQPKMGQFDTGTQDKKHQGDKILSSPFRLVKYFDFAIKPVTISINFSNLEIKNVIFNQPRQDSRINHLR